MSDWKATANKGNGGGYYEKAPAGNHPAVLVGIFDMGTQRNEFQGKESWQHRLYFVWELVTKKMTGTTGRNHHIGLDLTFSLNEKAKLRKLIEARTGKSIPDGQEYEITNELGKPCLLNVVMNKDYPKIEGMAGAPDGIPFPAAQTTPVAMSLAQFRAGP